MFPRTTRLWPKVEVSWGVVPGGGPSSSFTANVIESTLAPLKGLHVKKDPILMESAPCTCWREPNTYSFRENDRDGRVVFTATEQSDKYERCFCSPHHSMMLHVKDDDGEDMFTLERQGCISAKPFLCCFPMFQGCADEITIHKGKVDGEAGKVVNPNPIYAVRQTTGCDDSLCRPTVKVFVPHASEEEIILNGPQCFGGCSEFCQESRFNAAGTDNKDKGYVVKEGHRTCTEMMGESCTEINAYRMSTTMA